MLHYIFLYNIKFNYIAFNSCVHPTEFIMNSSQRDSEEKVEVAFLPMKCAFLPTLTLSRDRHLLQTGQCAMYSLNPVIAFFPSPKLTWLCCSVLKAFTGSLSCQEQKIQLRKGEYNTHTHTHTHTYIHTSTSALSIALYFACRHSSSIE